MYQYKSNNTYNVYNSHNYHFRLNDYETSMYQYIGFSSRIPGGRDSRCCGRLGGLSTVTAAADLHTGGAANQVTNMTLSI
jgi:hypothetical protein